MKKQIAIAFACTLLMLWGFIQNKDSKPNFLFIIVDDLRPEIHSLGVSEIKTPNIDKLALESAVFERAYCNVPVCGASRASLMSGIRPGRFRFQNHFDYLNNHYPGAKSLPRVLKEMGYTTISNGKVFHNKDDEKEAWTEIFDVKLNNSGDYASEENVKLLAKTQKTNKRGYPFESPDVADHVYRDGRVALKIIEDLRKLKKSGEPFFLTAGFHKPHLPFNAPKKYWDLYDENAFNLPQNYSQPSTTPRVAFHNSGELRNYYGVPDKGFVSDEMAKKLIHGYYACVSYTDAQIGLIMNELKQQGLDKNTVVILIGDHGWNLGDHQLWNKHCNFESSLNAPLLLKVPNVTNGKHYQNIVEFIDIFPTITEIASIKNPTTVQGESLLPLITSRKRIKNFAISQWRDGLTLIHENYFYTEWRDKDDKRTFRMLFDHKNDPLENQNISEVPSNAKIVDALSAMLYKHRGEDYWIDRRIEKN